MDDDERHELKMSIGAQSMTHQDLIDNDEAMEAMEDALVALERAVDVLLEVGYDRHAALGLTMGLFLAVDRNG